MSNYEVSEEEKQKIIAEEKLRDSIRTKPQTSILTSILNGFFLILFFLFVCTKIFS